MAVSVFDLFKIGMGPSSSHTVGPMRAARQFVGRLQHADLLGQTVTVRCWLHGSLGATGKGHASDVAVLLGLCGHEPDTVDVDHIPTLLAQARSSKTLHLGGVHSIAFNEKDDLLFMRAPLPFHANGMRFCAMDATGNELANRVYYSVGGGFIVSDEVAADGSRQKVIAPDATVLPLPFTSGDQLLEVAQREGLTIAQVMRRNEQHWRTDAEIDAGLLRIWQVMQDCVRRGCRTEGVLPGGFKVKRRAAPLFQALSANPEACWTG
jgi:L-serine dehydratase